MAANDLAQLRRWTRERDAEAFEDLARRYAGMVFATCRRILRDEAQAEEVSQECFLKLARADTRVSTNVPGWLHRTATNLSLNRYKENTRRSRREESYAAASPQASEPAWDDVQPLIDEAIDALPDKLRHPIVRHFLGGKTQRDVADELGLTESQASYRIKRGVEEVRESLRRKGIVIGTAALTAHLAELSGAEACGAVIAALGKIALAGPGVATSASVAFGSAFTLGAWLTVAAGVTIAVVAAVALLGDRAAAPADPQGTPAAVASSGSDVPTPQTDSFAMAQAVSPALPTSVANAGAFAQARRGSDEARNGPGPNPRNRAPRPDWPLDIQPAAACGRVCAGVAGVVESI